MDWLKGKKTYIVALIAGACVAAQMAFGVEIPASVWEVLGIAGGVTMRAAIASAEGK